MATKRSEPRQERTEPADKPETIGYGPGQADHSFTPQAVMAVQRDLGAVMSKLDRAISDIGTQGDKIDQLRHQVSFVRGAIFVVAGIVALTGYLLSNHLTSVIADFLTRQPSAVTHPATQQPPP